MAFYLCAHFILLSVNAKILLGIFSKLLETHSIIMRVNIKQLRFLEFKVKKLETNTIHKPKWCTTNR